MKRLSIRKKKEARWAYLFISPFIIGFVVFMLGPMAFSVAGSFTDYNLTSKMNFIGLANFRRMFLHDDLFWKSLYNTVYFVLFNVPLTTILNQKIKGISIFRTMFYLPAVLSGVAIYILWMQLLSPSAGLVNTFLGWFNIDGPAWLFDPNWTKPALILMKIWSSGGAMLLYLTWLLCRIFRVPCMNQQKLMEQDSGASLKVLLCH